MGFLKWISSAVIVLFALAFLCKVRFDVTGNYRYADMSICFSFFAFIASSFLCGNGICILYMFWLYYCKLRKNGLEKGTGL